MWRAMACGGVRAYQGQRNANRGRFKLRIARRAATSYIRIVDETDVFFEWEGEKKRAERDKRVWCQQPIT